MSVRLAVSRGLELGRSVLHTGISKPSLRAAAKLRPADRLRPAPPLPLRAPPPRAFLPARYRYYRTSLRGLAARMFTGGNPRTRTGLLAFGLGVALVERQLEDRRSVETCQEIQTVFRKQRLWPRPPPIPSGYRLEDYVVGRQIGKGSNAAVYEAAAHLAPPTEADRKLTEVVEEEEVASGGKVSCCSLRNFPLAIKMMWNFGASSSSASILRSMCQELVPASRSALKEAELHLDGAFGVVPRRVASHPNIIRVYRAFTADVPLLPGARQEYPDLLPARLNPNGLGNNRTLFLVMKHYPCTLRQYLSSGACPSRLHRVLMLLQLLEGVDHLNRHAVAHRDLKTDNVLLELDPAGVPRLVISDFGCCLSQSDSSLQLDFSSVWVDRGGNASLMAPEVALAVPGGGVVLDYSRADVWAVGAMAYELLGQVNPFYCGLDSRRYREEELPPPPVATATPDTHQVIRLLLRRDPRKRPSARVAANMLHLSVWGGRLLSELDGAPLRRLREWLLCRSAAALLHGVGGGRGHLVEAELQRNFLSNLELEELNAAVGFLMAGRERRQRQCLAAIEA